MIWHQQSIHISPGKIPNAYNYVDKETGWMLLSDTQTEMYSGDTWLSKASPINTNDNAWTITAIAKHIKEFDFDFIINDDIYLTWFQDWHSPDGINSDESSRWF